MKRFLVTITGISPYLMNPMTEETLEGLRTGLHPKPVKDISRLEQAKKKITYDERGEIAMPTQNLFSCLINAGRFVKYDAKRLISTKDSTLLPSFLSLEQEYLPFSQQGWSPDARRGRLPDGTAVCIVRPKFPSWGFRVHVQIDEKQIALDKITELFRMAGTMIGLGDFRPYCRGQFGRFVVEKWEEVAIDVSGAA